MKNMNKDDEKQDDNDFVYEDDDHLSSHDQWQQCVNYGTPYQEHITRNIHVAY